jgi:signal transduction histidine kinase
VIKSRWFSNPITVFVFSIVALGLSLYIYIQSYLEVNDAFTDFVSKRNLEASQFFEPRTWVTIFMLAVLVAIILLGLMIIFIYYQKMFALYRMQQNFINGFTHELKTPIASLRLFLDTFVRHDLPRAEQLKYLEFMKRDTDRLSDNVSEILNLAKIEEKKYEAQYVEADILVFAQNWANKASGVVENADLTFEGKGDFRLSFDPLLMGMLLTNLINNAINHSDQKRPRVCLRFSANEKMVEMDCLDDGPGIPKSERKKIFKKFYQIGKSSKGSGLGLYLVMHIARLHRGNVCLGEVGLDGRGACLSVSFPREKRS